MVTGRFLKATVFMCMVFCTTIAAPLVGFGQDPTQQQFNFKVDQLVNSLNLTENTSKKLTFGYTVHEVVIGNQEVLQATPIAPNEILVRGLKPGVTTLTMIDHAKKSQTIEIHVLGDVRKLEAILKMYFPDSHVRVNAMNTGVFLAGTVARADEVNKIVDVSKRYFPEVENNLRVGGSQLVAIEVQVYEVSRTKLRQLGVDWALDSGAVTIVQSVSDLISAASVAPGSLATGTGQTLSFGVINDGTTFTSFLQALEKKNLAKLMDKPTLVAINGRPANFLSGGEVPIVVNGGLGVASIEFRPFGTKLDIVPIVLGHGRVRLEVRAEVSEVANDLSGNTGTPGFRVRRVDTGVEMRAGHTLALAGDYREEIEAEVKGLPWLVNTPVLGSLFRRVEENKNEVELVFLVTPRFIGEVESHQLPAYGPGRDTTSPNDCELFLNGHLEVPRCDTSCDISIHRPYGASVPVVGENQFNHQYNLDAQANPGSVNYTEISKMSSGQQGTGISSEVIPRFQSPDTQTEQTQTGFGYPGNIHQPVNRRNFQQQIPPQQTPPKQDAGNFNRWPTTNNNGQ